MKPRGGVVSKAAGGRAMRTSADSPQLVLGLLVSVLPVQPALLSGEFLVATENLLRSALAKAWTVRP